MSIRLAVVAAAICGLAFGGLALASTPTKLAGQVGPGFTISLKDSKGQKVKTLKPGSYVFAVKDKSDIHNFTLKGPGVGNKELTGTGFTGSKTSSAIRLKAGSYKVYCSVHGFSQSFTVK